MKLLKNEKTPLLRNYLTLPLQLNADPDDKLLVATEGRVPSFSHDFVPNMLRTKPEPDVEKRHLTLEAKMAQINGDTAQVGFVIQAFLRYVKQEFCVEMYFNKGFT